MVGRSVCVFGGGSRQLKYGPYMNATERKHSLHDSQMGMHLIECPTHTLLWHPSQHRGLGPRSLGCTK